LICCNPATITTFSLRMPLRAGEMQMAIEPTLPPELPGPGDDVPPVEVPTPTDPMPTIPEPPMV